MLRIATVPNIYGTASGYAGFLQEMQAGQKCLRVDSTGPCLSAGTIERAVCSILELTETDVRETGCSQGNILELLRDQMP